jgi:hypothetical protein
MYRKYNPCLYLWIDDFEPNMHGYNGHAYFNQIKKDKIHFEIFLIDKRNIQLKAKNTA